MPPAGEPASRGSERTKRVRDRACEAPVNNPGSFYIICLHVGRLTIERRKEMEGLS